jgi:hypothetical protein
VPLRSLFPGFWAVVFSILIPSGSESWILERDASGEGCDRLMNESERHSL